MPSTTCRSTPAAASSWPWSASPGCGKSVMATALSGLLPASATVTGSVRLRGEELVGASAAELRRARGRRIGYIFQEPMTSLNPVFTVGRQIGEVLKLHEGMDRRAAQTRAAELLDLVGIANPRERLRQYPHQLSGGLRQRVMIAMAVAGNPEVLVADEPTTALDVTVQAGILDVLRDLRDRLGAAVVLITHDLAVVADVADRVVVMYAGRMVERADIDDLFARPRHHYTVGLLGAVPTARTAGGADHRLREIPGLVPTIEKPEDRCTFAERCPAADALCRTQRPPLAAAPDTAAGHEVACWHPAGVDRRRGGRMTAPVCEVVDLVKHFGPVHAVDGMSLEVGPGEVVALVGESGSGKSTVGRLIVRLLDPTSGQVLLRGVDVSALSRRAMRPHRRAVSIVFQDPASSLDPRMSVGDLVAEPLRLHGVPRAERRDKVRAMLEKVGMRAGVAERYPHELSGGQRQRVSIARALVTQPSLLIADEPTSALDVSVQASVLNLLADLQRDLGFACLFITHDLAAVEYLADRVVVMYLGRVAEVGAREQIFSAPRHPYTQALLSSAPVPDPREQRRRRRVVLSGELPSQLDPPTRLPLPHPLSAGRGALPHRGARAAPDARRRAGGVPPRRRRRHRSRRPHGRRRCGRRGTTEDRAHERRSDHAPRAARLLRHGVVDPLAGVAVGDGRARGGRQRLRRRDRRCLRPPRRRAAPQRAGRRGPGGVRHRRRPDPAGAVRAGHRPRRRHPRALPRSRSRPRAWLRPARRCDPWGGRRLADAGPRPRHPSAPRRPLLRDRVCAKWAPDAPDRGSDGGQGRAAVP